jgi:SAM-dependent methyltransferase
VEWASRHLAGVRDRLPVPLGEVRAFEFGAGWDLVVPLSYWAAGIAHQTLIDVAPHVRLELANHTLARMAALGPQLQDTLGVPTRPVDGTLLRDLDDLDRRFGITYKAPANASRTGFDDGAFHLVTTSDTLEHVPVEALVPILAECRRLLVPGGVMSHLIDMMDHYRYIDPSITVYNFLRFSDRAWRVLNSPVEPQNRLRLPDYRGILADAGLEILEEEVKEASEDDLALLRSTTLAPRFRGYALEDLGVKSVRVTAVPNHTYDHGLSGPPPVPDTIRSWPPT